MYFVSPDPKTFVFIDAKTVGLDADISLKVLLHRQQVSLGLLSLGQLGVEMVDGLVDGADLLHHLDVSRVVAVLYLGSVASFLQSGLRDFQRISLCTNCCLKEKHENSQKETKTLLPMLATTSTTTTMT